MGVLHVACLVMVLQLIVTLALLTETVVVCHPSLYLTEIAENNTGDPIDNMMSIQQEADDKNEDIIDNMMSILQEAEIANKNLTEEEMEQLSRDYSDYCNCQCSVNLGTIFQI